MKRITATLLLKEAQSYVLHHQIHTVRLFALQCSSVSGTDNTTGRQLAALLLQVQQCHCQRQSWIETPVRFICMVLLRVCAAHYSHGENVEQETRSK